MYFHLPFGGRSRGPIVGLATLALLPLSACQTTRPDHATESSITSATAIGEPLTFLVEGGAIDEPAVGETLTFIDATRRAVMTDPGLQAALARVRIAMADADQSRLLPNPVLNFVLRWGPGKPQVEVSLAQDLIQAFQIPKRSSAADNRLRQSAADAVTVALDVVAEVQERYIAAQASDRLVPVHEGRLDILRRLSEVARSRLEGGEGIRGDVTTLDAQRVELEAEIYEAMDSQRIERLRLARLIGEPSLAAMWSLDTWVVPNVVASPEQDWIDAALLHRPEVQSVAWQLAALGDEYALTRLLPWEGLAVGVDAQRSPDEFVGPSVSTPIPIFDTGQARQARVTAEQIEARHALTMSKRKVVEEVRLAHFSLAASIVQLDRIRNELIPLQQQRREQAEQAYLAGQTDTTALFLAEQDLQATQAKVIELERLTSVSLVRLQRAVGGPGIAADVAQPQVKADLQAELNPRPYQP
tara:strand:- start:7341 stop:8756 length:1416 start_codon:yes stop_codon:yes gene_type:complete